MCSVAFTQKKNTFLINYKFILNNKIPHLVNNTLSLEIIQAKPKSAIFKT